MPERLADYLPTTSIGMPAHIPTPILTEPGSSRRAASPASQRKHTPERSSSRPLSEAPDPPEPPLYYQTKPDTFGVFRCYVTRPRAELQGANSLGDLTDTATLHPQRTGTQDVSAAHGFGPRVVQRLRAGIDMATEWFYPFLNATVFRLMAWANTGSALKSDAELQRLVDEVILAEDFDREHLRCFRVAKEQDHLDTLDKPDNVFSSADGWHETSVKISVPKEGVRLGSEVEAPVFEIPNVYHRRLTEVIRSAAEQSDANTYNWLSFRQYWNRAAHATGSTGAASSDSEEETRTNSQTHENIRLFSDLPNTDAMLEEEARICAQPRNTADGPQVEYVVAPLMPASDSAHLANFGGAHLWPVYIFVAWMCKYVRACPSAFAAHHLAYLPSLPETLQDWYQKQYGISATSDILRFCKKELMHAIWLLIMDDEFMAAYHNGMLVHCGDGILRRIFPRFFTYSADYPEKALLACIRFLGRCPCPRCLVEKANILKTGWSGDQPSPTDLRTDSSTLRSIISRVRRWIFERGYTLASKAISTIMDPISVLPTQSAFSVRLADTGFNFYSVFVPDVLHEFELGVWKAIFIHLLRILYAEGKDRIQIMNERFRRVPTFGRSTIRRFARNVSGMKQMAGRDFEDILQCILPMVDGLLPPPHDDRLQRLLFQLAYWHGLAKLRLHSEETLAIFHGATVDLGVAVRKFLRKVCKAYNTQELPREEAARGRRSAAMAAKQSAAGIKSKKQPSNSNTASRTQPGASGPKQKLLNLLTFKYHSLTHYPFAIPWFGTLDVMNTQQSELEHRHVKRFYMRTNKNNAARQIARRQRRQHHLMRIMEKDRQRRADLAAEAEAHWQASAQQQEPQSATQPQPRPSDLATPRNGTLHHAEPSDGSHVRRGATLALSEQEPLPFHTSAKERYHISDSERHYENIFKWVNAPANRKDCAFKDFIPMLKDHLLSRLTDREYDGDESGGFGPDEHDTVRFVNDRIYFHKALRINYTTYNMRRAQDTLNTQTQCDVMLLAPPEDDGDENANTHPYWYARIIGILHVNVKHRGFLSKSKNAQRMDVLWIRWFGRDNSAPGGFETCRLHRVGFIDSDSSDPSFGFLDPRQVLRASHMIPGFSYGRTEEYLPPSIARQPEDKDEDYVYYYIGMFVDRDMLMRYLGGAVGHKGLPSNRITARSLLLAIAKYLHLCKPTHSLRYPQDGLNAALVDDLWGRAANHDHAGNGAEDPVLSGDQLDGCEAAEGVPSDEEDFAYRWEYEEDIEDEGSGEEGGEEHESGNVDAVDDDLNPDDMEGDWEDEYDTNGYAPL
ncbi:hypothetical protein DAEQUDRAFT_815297 [Daedalea quercina L-15889]|uniref:Uncharacterized protein n=1 Tax=Daedalea quercina L-15889 TaxID=1314783 RepID=A0A165L5Q5_9APHY|nr:hypothetical protein DAEQUDRAFT_815297 [Daedalea quercina L-15889]